jgi:hypothetical protein
MDHQNMNNSHNHGYPTESRRVSIARALYEHWVEEDFTGEYASWDDLDDKATWLERADAVEAVL